MKVTVVPIENQDRGYRILITPPPIHFPYPYQIAPFLEGRPPTKRALRQAEKWYHAETWENFARHLAGPHKIADAILAYLASRVPASAELAEGALADAYLTFGDHLYAMRPVAQVGTARALATMRQAVRSRAEAEAASIVFTAQEAATTSARDALVAAEHQRAQINEAKRVWREEKEAGCILPRWLSGWPISFSKDLLFVRTTILFRILRYEWLDPCDSTRTCKLSLPAEPGPPMRRFVYIALSNEHINYSLCRLDVEQDFLPHISDVRTCISPGTTPPAVRCAENIFEVGRQLQRCCETVNLSSLLVTPIDWGEDVRRTIPMRLRDKLDDPRVFNNFLQDTNFFNEEEGVAVEGPGWEVPRAPRIATAPPTAPSITQEP